MLDSRNKKRVLFIKASKNLVTNEIRLIQLIQQYCTLSRGCEVSRTGTTKKFFNERNSLTPMSLRDKATKA